MVTSRNKETEVMQECLEEMRYQQILPIIRDNRSWERDGKPDPETYAREIAHAGGHELTATYGLLAFAMFLERMRLAREGRNGKD